MITWCNKVGEINGWGKTKKQNFSLCVFYNVLLCISLKMISKTCFFNKNWFSTSSWWQYFLELTETTLYDRLHPLYPTKYRELPSQGGALYTYRIFLGLSPESLLVNMIIKTPLLITHNDLSRNGLLACLVLKKTN